MKKLLATALLLTAGLSTSAHAGFISGSQTTAGGKTVNLQGLEWMPLTYTAGLSRNQVEAAGGFTDRFGGVWNAGDWRYATRAETETLLGSLWGGVYNGWSRDNHDGAFWFTETFGGLAFDQGYGNNRINGVQTNKAVTAMDYSLFYFGQVGECQSLTRSCIGDVSILSNRFAALSAVDARTNDEVITYSSGSGAAGYIVVEHGIVDNSGNAWTSTFKPTAGIENLGSLLVRSAVGPTIPVDTPPLSLFALGFAALLLRRRKIV